MTIKKPKYENTDKRDLHLKAQRPSKNQNMKTQKNEIHILKDTKTSKPQNMKTEKKEIDKKRKRDLLDKEY